MEAGKERLTRDTVKDATRQEIEHLKRENHDGRTTTEEPRRKQLVADLSLESHRFKLKLSKCLISLDSSMFPFSMSSHRALCLILMVSPCLP